jgi:hypothetical protein
MLASPDPSCFFCGHSFLPERLGLPEPGEKFHKVTRMLAAPTTEHLLARSIGGTHHRRNCVLAHKLCNMRAGSMSVEEKLRLKQWMEKEPQPDFLAEAIARRERRIRAKTAAASIDALSCSNAIRSDDKNGRIGDMLPCTLPKGQQHGRAVPAVATHHPPIS